MHLLDRLAGGIFLSSADRMVEDDDFLHAVEPLTEERLDLGVVGATHGGVLGGEELVRGGLGGGAVDGEAGVVGREVGFLAAQVRDWEGVVAKHEGLSRTVDFGPRLAGIRCRVDVLESGGRHRGCVIILRILVRVLSIGLPAGCEVKEFGDYNR